MGWSCGELFTYSSDYWNDPNVIACRSSEARAVCSQLFQIADNPEDQLNIDQENTGLNFFTLNAFGQEHEVSHVGFFFFVLLLAVACLIVWALRKRMRDMKKVLRGSGLQSPTRRTAMTPTWSRTTHPWSDQAHVVRFDPGQLSQIQTLLGPAIRDREFQEVGRGGVSRPVGRRPEEEEEQTQTQADTNVQRVRSTPISQIGGV